VVVRDISNLSRYFIRQIIIIFAEINFEEHNERDCVLTTDILKRVLRFQLDDNEAKEMHSSKQIEICFNY